MLSLICSVAVSQSPDATIEPVSAVGNEDGSEIIANVVLKRPDGTSESLEFQFTDSEITTAGGTIIPPVEGFQVLGAPAPEEGGSWGAGPYPGDVGGPNPPTQPFGDDMTPMVWPVIAIGGACAVGHYIAKRSLGKVCNREGKHTKSLEVGYCGLLGKSKVMCSEMSLPEPPEPDAMFWQMGHLNMMWNPPGSWGWGQSGSPWVIQDTIQDF